jgi:hypothetical protein
MKTYKQKTKVEKRKTVAEYLTYFEAKGIEKGYFELKEIRFLGKTCCFNATTEVIDFDKTKEKLEKSDNLNTPSSCDGLKIRPDKNCIDLIEIKGLIKFFEWFKEGSEQLEKSIDEKIEKFDLHKKIEDSLHLLETVVRKNEFGKTDEDTQFFRNTKINYILLTDIESKNQAFEDIAYNFMFYGLDSNSIANHVKSKFNAELDAIPNINYKLNKPMLKTCSEIDAYYAQ